MGLRVLLITQYLIQKILVDTVLDFHARCVKLKKFIYPYVVMMHLLQKKKKRFIEKYLCWFAHIELYVLYETMVERMIGSLSNSSNMHEVVDDNSNHY